MRTALLLVPMMLVVGCRTRVASDTARDWYAAAGLSALPQIGVEASAGRVLSRTDRADWSAEAGGAFQFIDDKDLADDNNAGAGSYTQLRVGLRHEFSPGHRRRFTLTYGALWFRATGEPLIVEDAGDYVGGYASLGFVTELSPRLSIGPDFRVVAVQGADGGGFEAFPQIGWNLFYRW